MRDLGRYSELPTRFVGIGECLVRYSRTLVCIRRPEGLVPSDACSGCWFRQNLKMGRVITNCNDIQCSCFDREDGEDVWFVGV